MRLDLYLGYHFHELRLNNSSVVALTIQTLELLLAITVNSTFCFFGSHRPKYSIFHDTDGVFVTVIIRIAGSCNDYTCTLGLEGSINTLQLSICFGTTTSALTMVLKLHGVYRSAWVRLVAAVLVEKQVPFELVSVDLANGEHKSPEYLAKHPFGQVPYIVCDSL